MSNQDVVTYTFELKDLSYSDLYIVYKEMIDFIALMKKNYDTAEVVKEENSEEQ